MAKRQHSNLHSNKNTHHLYLIYDFEKRVIFTFGISDKPINEKMMSSRLFNQLRLYNRVAGAIRFAGRIISHPIAGRLNARILEDEWILKFKSKYGILPRGNENHIFLKKK